MTADRDRLQATLGRPELARLVQRLRTRLERGMPLQGTLILAGLNPAEKDAVSRLLGRPPTRANAVGISLEHLDEKLQAAGISPSLREAVEQLTGPVSDRRAEREALEEQWNALYTAAAKRIGTRPALETWLGQLRTTGMLRRYGLAEATRLLTQALDVLAALPAPDVPLAELAAGTLGDAHALDPDTSLASLVIRAAALLGKGGKIDDARSRRDAWARVGVICDELSGAVLVLNLRPSGETATSQALRLYAASGEPTVLTIRQLLRTDLVFLPQHVGPAVYICENPSVVAAAARRLGPACHPLVCIDGQPRTATRLLLDRLRVAGLSLWYHGDFDWPGIQIANTILQRHGAFPWRMAVSDYRAAALGPLALAGAPVAASWDATLMPAMRDTGIAVHEEQVTDTLLSDLRNAAP